MSYILDAIARSEQERQQKEVPGVNTLALPAGPAPRPRSSLPYIIAGALLLNAALLMAWMQSSPTPTSMRSPDAPAGLAAGSNAGVPVVPGPSRQTSMVDSTIEQADAPASAFEPIDEPVMPATGADPADRPFTSEPADAAVVDETADWVRIGPETLLNKARAGQQAGPTQVPSAEGSYRRVSSVSQLPESVRADLPTVVFSGHLHSSDPTSSIVFVDGGRPVSSGRQIVDDVFLHEITATGVVVEFRGYLIDVGVLQNWTLN